MPRLRWAVMEVTVDPYVRIETRLLNTIRYCAIDGRRWEVHGTCDRRGDCLIGAFIKGETVRDKQHLTQIVAANPADFPGEYDTPVTPEFEGCCNFTYTELTPEVPVV